MARLESNLKNMVLVLPAVALIAAFALASVNMLTAVPIEKAKQKKQQEAIVAVLPDFDECKEPELVNGLNVFKAYKNKQFVGAAVAASSPNGFSGDVSIMVGFDKNGNIYDYVVLEQKETPGLGSKMLDWFRTEKGNQNIRGKNPAIDKMLLTKDGGEIDAITASTISSRAFLECVQTAYLAYANNTEAPDAHSSATQQVAKKDSMTTDTIQIDTIQEVKIEVEQKQKVVVVQPQKNTEKPKTETRVKKDTVVKQQKKEIKKDTVRKQKNSVEKELHKKVDSIIDATTSATHQNSSDKPAVNNEVQIALDSEKHTEDAKVTTEPMQKGENNE